MGGRVARDLTGQTFGLVTVLGRAGGDRRGPVWLLLCECGQRRVGSPTTFLHRPPTTHIACSKAKWAEREAALLLERETRDERDLAQARHESTVRRTG